MPKIQLILHTQNEISIAEIMLGLAPPFQATSCIPSFEATNIIILYIYTSTVISPLFFLLVSRPNNSGSFLQRQLPTVNYHVRKFVKESQ